MSINPFKKKKPAPSKPQPSNGFFSTHSDDGAHDRPTIERVGKAIDASFQLSVKNFKVIDPAGKPITAGAYAMDDIGNMSSMQDVKSLNSLGRFGNIPIAQFEWFASQGFIGYQVCAMLMQHWLIEKACEMPGKDAVRHGWENTVNDGEDVNPKVIAEIEKLDKKFKIKKNCIEFIKFGRGFGIRIAMFIVNSPDPEYYAKPFNPDGITPGSYRGISQIDPYWITPELAIKDASDPASMHFYEPTWWRVNGVGRIHRSHLVIWRNGDVADILKPTYLYGGIPLPQKIMERVYGSERTANEGPLLAMTKRLTAIHVDMAAAQSNWEMFLQKMQFWTALQNNFGVKALGKEELIEQFDTSLTDLDAVIMTQFQLAASIAEVPATKLLGTSPKGMDATGEFEMKDYHEFLESFQENVLTELVDRHHLLLMRSWIAPKFGIKPFEINISWRPVDTPSAKEQAETNYIKAQTDAQLVQCGAIDSYDVRQRIIKDNDSGYNGLEKMVPGGPGDREAEQEQQGDEERRTEEAHQAALNDNVEA